MNSNNQMSIGMKTFIFLLALGFSIGLGLKMVIPVIVIAAAVHFARFKGNLKSISTPWMSFLNTVALAALVSIAPSFTNYKINQANEEIKQRQIATLKKAEALVTNHKYSEALTALAENQKPSEAESDLKTAIKPLTDSQLLNRFAMDLPEDTFNKISTGKNATLATNETLNKDLNEALQKEFPKFKTTYLKILAVKKKDQAKKDKAEKIAKDKADRAEKERLYMVKHFGSKPVASGWDGSYYAVKKYLEDVANDPDSIKIKGCTKPLADKKRGWIVGCEFYGKNAFGATIKNARWFFIMHDAVIASAENY